jgi:hypothetical protein
MEWVVNVTPRPLYPLQRNPVYILEKAALEQGRVWKDAENLAPPEVDPRTVRGA